MRFGRCLSTLSAVAAFAFSATASFAQIPEIRFARQFSMGYLQFNIIEREKLLEKHAKALGIPEIKVSWSTFNGPSAMNDALLSGAVDVVTGGVPGLLTIWARTQNTPNPIKGIAAFTSQPILLNTNKASIQSIADFTDADKIAVPSVKISIQAIILQMAAAQKWGQANYAKLDPMTVSMSAPEATIALMSDSGGVTAVFSVPPFQSQQVEKPNIRTILNSYDVFGGPHTFTCAWTSSQFHDKNPVLYKALYAAFEEATEKLQKDTLPAAQYWQDDVKSKMAVEKIAEIAKGPQVKWTMAPENAMKYADFMHSVGSIKQKPATWKDLFFPEAHGLPGS